MFSLSPRIAAQTDRKSKVDRFIPIVDDRSDLFVLASSHLPPGATNHNWLEQAVVSEEAFDKLIVADDAVRERLGLEPLGSA